MDLQALIQQPAPTVEIEPGIWMRDETQFVYGAARGTKCRVILAHVLAAGGPEENLPLVTAGGRFGTQGVVAATLARALGMRSVYFTTMGPETPTLRAIVEAGGSVYQVKPGHRSVLNARAREYAAEAGGVFVPAWCEGPLGVATVAACVGTLPAGVGRIVAPVGGGVTLAGLTRWAMSQQWPYLVHGVSVGSDNWRNVCTRQLPPRWASVLTVQASAYKYEEMVPATFQAAGPDPRYQKGLCYPMDPIYSGKVIMAGALRPGDLFWNSGARWWANT